MSTGFIALIDEPKRADELHSAIEVENRFTDALSAPDWPIRRKAVALISFERGYLHYAALAKRGNRIATQKFRVTFSDFVDLGNLSVDQLGHGVPGSIRRYFTRATAGPGEPLPPRTWRAVLDGIGRLRPDLVAGLQRLENLSRDKGQKVTDNETRQLAEEQDAFTLAKRIFTRDSGAERLSWSSGDDEALPSFLAGLSQPSVTEDVIIQHDSEVFGAWRLVRRYQVGAVELVRGDAKLTVLTANRRSLERSLGVDLIYWHQKYRAFTMVQYKRMEVEGKPPRSVYRPKGSYHDEIDRMLAIQKAIRGGVDEVPLCRDYRLCLEPFFFKLCRVDRFDPSAQGLVKGMYFPLDYWNILIASDGVTGPRGGKNVQYENAGRYLTNSDFIRLVEMGWIGSCGVGTRHLESLVRTALEAGRAVDLAVSAEVV